MIFKIVLGLFIFSAGVNLITAITKEDSWTVEKKKIWVVVDMFCQITLAYFIGMELWG